MGKSVIIFEANMSSSVHIDNKNKDLDSVVLENYLNHKFHLLQEGLNHESLVYKVAI